MWINHQESAGRRLINDPEFWLGEDNDIKRDVWIAQSGRRNRSIILMWRFLIPSTWQHEWVFEDVYSSDLIASCVRQSWSRGKFAVLAHTEHFKVTQHISVECKNFPHLFWLQTNLLHHGQNCAMILNSDHPISLDQQNRRGQRFCKKFSTTKMNRLK